MNNIFADRDRENCKDCNYYNYLHCPYVKVDGICGIRGIQVRPNQCIMLKT